MLVNSYPGIMSSHLPHTGSKGTTYLLSQPTLCLSTWLNLTGQVTAGRQKLPAGLENLPFPYLVALGPIY